MTVKKWSGWIPGKWKSMILLSLVLLVWQGAQLSLRSKIPSGHKITASSGLQRGTRDFFPFFYHKGLFPITSDSLKEHFSEERVNQVLNEHGETLVMDRLHAIRSGDMGKIFLYLPSAWIYGGDHLPSITPANRLLFVLGLLLLLLRFHLYRQTLLGITVVFSIGSYGFQLYEVYARENIFGLPISVSLIIMSAFLPLILERRESLRNTVILVLATGILLGFFRHIRTEIVVIALSVALLLLLNMQLTLPKRVFTLVLLVAAFHFTNQGMIYYFKGKIDKAHHVVEEKGGRPYDGPRIMNHDFWHPLWVGLGDFDTKYGYSWNDSKAVDYAIPILKERYNILFDANQRFYRGKGLYYARPYELPEYSQIIKEKFLYDISNDPGWYAGIIGNRILRIFTESAPIVPIPGIGSVKIYFNSWLALLVLLGLLWARRWGLLLLILFPFPLLLTALTVYSGGGTVYYWYSHIVAFAVVLYLAADYLSLRVGLEGTRRSPRSVLSRYPKSKPSLPEAYQKIYTAYYQTNRGGKSAATGLAQKMESWMHREIANQGSSYPGTHTILEIGAGNLNHVEYEKSYATYDVIEPFEELYRDIESKSRIQTFYSDISELPEGRLYDRIISIAVFEHLERLPEITALAASHLAPGGVAQIAIPSQGSLPWKLGYTLTTGLEFWLKYHLTYSTLMDHEHINNWKEIAITLEHFFQQISFRSFGPARPFSFYQVYHCSAPDSERVADHLTAVKNKSDISTT